MKRLEFLGLLAGMGGLAGCQVVEPVWQLFTTEAGKANDMLTSPFRTTKIMSWNIRAGLGMDGVRDISRAAAIIKEVGADFVAVQEVDRNTKRSGGVDQVAELEKGTGMVATWCKAIDHDGGEYGVVLLSRAAPIGVCRIELPRLKKTEQRMLLLAEFPDLFIGVTHLSLDAEERMAAADVIRGYMNPDKPFFLAGDWNAEPSSDLVKSIRKSFAIVSGFDKTFPAPGPKVCIDYIAVSRRHRARFDHVYHEVLPEMVVSDHRPVVATLR